MKDLRALLAVDKDRLDAVNDFLLSGDNEMMNQLLEVVERFGGPEEINRKAAEAGDPANLMQRLKDMKSPYVENLEWLAEQRDRGAFVGYGEYCSLHGADAAGLNQANAVTLEVSALQFFPWIIAQARHAIANQELMPGRIIRVRNMAEQKRDNGDIMATSLAAKMIGASLVETLDTKGTDGSNVHLGGPATITGYFGGVGQPNGHPIQWLEEVLQVYTEYGIRQVLNINPGTVLVGYLLNKLGVDNEFKISVFMGNDNPFSILWTLMTARLFARDDGRTSLIGFNLANSANNETIRQANRIRAALGLTDQVRFEHHITETYKSIVIQPYNRRDELAEIVREVPNISAKHEGGEPEVEAALEHPSDLLDYFLSKEEILKNGLMEPMQNNYIEKHKSMNLSARAVLRAGVAVAPAQNLHNR